MGTGERISGCQGLWGEEVAQRIFRTGKHLHGTVIRHMLLHICANPQDNTTARVSPWVFSDSDTAVKTYQL